MIRPLAVIAVLACLAPAFAEDWPGWRGPRRDGTATDAKYPTTWSGTENVAWKVPIPGVGHSSPVVSKGCVFLTTCLVGDGEKADPKKRQLLCLDRATGKTRWTADVLAAKLEPKHKLNSYASGTPVADGERVYVTFHDQPNLRVYCYDFQGKKVWDTSPGEFHSVHGFSSSPLLFEDLLIVNGDQDPKKSGKAYLVALDKLTGQEKWRIDRPNRLRSYCPPVLVQVAGKPQVILTGSKCVASYDPATGKQLWLVNGPTEQFVSSVVSHDGIVFLTAGFPERWVMALDPTGTGNVTKTHILWSKKNEGGYVPSPVAANGLAFWVTDEGIGGCRDLKTGDPKWKQRLGGHHSGSGVTAAGHVYFTDDDGVTFVLKAGPEFDLVSKNPLGEKCFSSPAFSDGDIFLRGDRHLFKIRAK